MAAYLTPEVVAARWGVSAGHVRALCRRGELAAMKTGTGAKSEWRIRPEAVEDFEARHANEPEAHPELVTMCAGPVAVYPAVGTEYAEVVPGPVPWRSTVIDARPALSRGSGAKRKTAPVHG